MSKRAQSSEFKQLSFFVKSNCRRWVSAFEGDDKQINLTNLKKIVEGSLSIIEHI